jgi:hypothetical protein
MPVTISKAFVTTTGLVGTRYSVQGFAEIDLRNMPGGGAPVARDIDALGVDVLHNGSAQVCVVTTKLIRGKAFGFEAPGPSQPGWDGSPRLVRSDGKPGKTMLQFRSLGFPVEDDPNKTYDASFTVLFWCNSSQSV